MRGTRLVFALWSLRQEPARRAVRWAVVVGRHIRTLINDDAAVLRLDVARPLHASVAHTDVVKLVLRVRRARCLERALVLQAWMAALGERRDVVIGVAPSVSLDAHAWLDGYEPPLPQRCYRELHRRPAEALTWVA